MQYVSVALVSTNTNQWLRKNIYILNKFLSLITNRADVVVEKKYMARKDTERCFIQEAVWMWIWGIINWSQGTVDCSLTHSINVLQRENSLALSIIQSLPRASFGYE